MQQGLYRIRKGARQRVRGTVDREQSQDARRAQGGLAWQLHQEPGELGKDEHQFVMEPLPGGRARLDQIASRPGQFAQRLDVLSGQGTGPGQPGEQTPGQREGIGLIGLRP